MLFLLAPVAVNALSTEEVIANYQNRVEQARRLQARVQMNFFPQFKCEIVDEMKPILESVYSLPVEDPIYAVSPLYFISNAVLNWDMILSGRRMSISQQTLSSDIRICREDPRIASRIESIRRLRASTGEFVDFRFSYDYTHQPEVYPRWSLTAPQALLEWHFIPNMWYPSLRQIGLPDSLSDVDFRRGDIEPHILLYTPRNLDESLLRLLRVSSANPNLRESDLLGVLAIEPNTYACLSFDICYHNGHSRHYLMKLHNTPSGSLVDGLAYPTSTSLSVIRRVRVDNESAPGASTHDSYTEEPHSYGDISSDYEWGMFYYGQMNYTRVEHLD